MSSLAVRRSSPGCLPLMAWKTLELRKRKAGRCAVRFCRRPRKKNRTLCACCLKRKERAANPMKDAFRNLKSNAKRRDIHFDLTFEGFAALCASTGYLEGRGNGKWALTIDRIDVRQGYTLTNLQILNRAANTHKRNYVDYLKPVSDVGGGGLRLTCFRRLPLNKP